MTYLLIALLWLIRLLPLPAMVLAGDALGTILYWLVAERRRVTRINLEKCFPRMPVAARERLARAHFRAFGRSFVELGIWWWSSRRRIERLVSVEGMEHLRALSGRPLIVLAPHFVGLEATACRLAPETRGVGMYTQPKNRRFGERLLRGRLRFGEQVLVTRQEGVRAVLRRLREGRTFYYMPDQDLGPRESIFVPFFGVQAATVPTLGRLARLARAPVLPCTVSMLPRGGYRVRIEPPWQDFPSGDDAADARRMNAYIESRVIEMPEQYFWMHKRFKTRPPGEAGFY
jgi:KDO2-lipid IV(A) lauroyltransferase